MQRGSENTGLHAQILYSPLPPQVYGTPDENPGQELLKVVASEMSSQDFERRKHDLVYRMHTRLAKPSRKRKQQANRKYLSKKQLKASKLDKLPKTGWNYSSLQEMRNMWTAYMMQCLTHKGKDNLLPHAPDVTDSGYVQFHNTLAKCELTGANILVLKSTVPSNVGIEGTIVLETQQTFQVVTPKNKLKVLLKQPSVFIFHLGTIQFEIYGQALLTRPHERCVKKMKSFLKLDL